MSIVLSIFFMKIFNWNASKSKTETMFYNNEGNAFLVIFKMQFGCNKRKRTWIVTTLGVFCLFSSQNVTNCEVFDDIIIIRLFKRVLMLGSPLSVVYFCFKFLFSKYLIDAKTFINCLFITNLVWICYNQDLNMPCHFKPSRIQGRNQRCSLD